MSCRCDCSAGTVWHGLHRPWCPAAPEHAAPPPQLWRVCHNTLEWALADAARVAARPRPKRRRR